MLNFVRSFLYLQNYARLKPEIALQALPVLQGVRRLLLQLSVILTVPGSRRLKSINESLGVKDDLIHTRPGICGRHCRSAQEADGG